jgi:hypothetical protein
MKKQIIIPLIFIIPFSSWSQKTIKTETPCTEEVLFKTPGRWLNTSSGYYINNAGLNFQSNQMKEVTKRVDAIHELMVKIYPQPLAVDAAWYPTLAYGSFAEQITYGRNSHGASDYTVVKKSQLQHSVMCAVFFPHGCKGDSPNEIWPDTRAKQPPGSPFLQIRLKLPP